MKKIRSALCDVSNTLSILFSFFQAHREDIKRASSAASPSSGAHEEAAAFLPTDLELYKDPKGIYSQAHKLVIKLLFRYVKHSHQYRKNGFRVPSLLQVKETAAWLVWVRICKIYLHCIHAALRSRCSTVMLFLFEPLTGGHPQTHEGDRLRKRGRARAGEKRSLRAAITSPCCYRLPLRIAPDRRSPRPLAIRVSARGRKGGEHGGAVWLTGQSAHSAQK